MVIFLLTETKYLTKNNFHIYIYDSKRVLGSPKHIEMFIFVLPSPSLRLADELVTLHSLPCDTGFCPKVLPGLTSDIVFEVCPSMVFYHLLLPFSSWLHFCPTALAKYMIDKNTHAEPFSTFAMQRSVFLSDGELNRMAMH